MEERKQWIHWKCPKCQTEFATPLGCGKCPKCGFGCDGLEVVTIFEESELEQRGFKRVNKCSGYEKGENQYLGVAGNV